jgi:hypothetical protein
VEGLFQPAKKFEKVFQKGSIFGVEMSLYMGGLFPAPQKNITIFQKKGHQNSRFCPY